MGRSRVRSFIAAFGGSSRKDNAGPNHRTSSASFTLNNPSSRTELSSTETPSPPDASPSPTEMASTGERRISRPGSTIFSHNPPLMELANDTPAELQPIFAYLNSHANKLYHEGYFLKLNDLDSHGRPCPDRQWVECYAQLVGTALSLWDAAALDAAGQEGEVPPTFINLADASIKMIETLPTRNQGVEPLKNVLSICSAGQNRYLLHFNSFHSLTQWAAAIRLSLFEHTSLYEAYTGSIIAGKGKGLNNIKAILERSRFKYEDWARVRFGAGTPWRRCWFVITPPDEKQLKKAQKSLKKSAYDRAPKLVTGDIKFYETKKTKKAKPIATITDAYSAFAIYPQTPALIEQSTLIKIEGNVTIHSQPQSSTEGFVFVMPEVHPAIPGFEMMLRFLMPTFDTFNLYGRPTRLIAATNHIKSIMFAFPTGRRYGYLDTLDIANLMQTAHNQNWSEAEWRKQLKEATARRMASGRSRTGSLSGGKPRFRASLPNRYSRVPSQASGAFPASQPGFNQSTDAIIHETPKDDTFSPVYHSRGASDTTGFSPAKKHPQDSTTESSPSSSAQELAPLEERERPLTKDSNDQSSSDGDWKQPEVHIETIGQQMRSPSPPAPVTLPPAFTHGPGDLPYTRPEPSPDLRKANNRMSQGTLTELAAASGKLNLLRNAGSPEDDHLATDLARANPYELTPIHSHTESEKLEPTRVFSDSPDGYSYSTSEQAPPPPEHGSGPFGAPLVNPARQSLQLDTTKSVRRKPLPPQQQYRGIAVTSPTATDVSFDDLRHTVDEDMLNRVGSHQFPSPDRETRQDEESVYDDASTTSPDYASTHESVYSRRSTKSITRPRMGVMKTVGEPAKKDLVIGDAHYTLDKPSQAASTIPSVDFGPTMTYLPTTGRPTTSDTLKKFGHTKNDSDVVDRNRFSVPTHPMDRPQSKSPNQEEYRRSVLWQPGMGTGRPVTPGGLTPEQFVHQRAASNTPVAMHHRSPSSTPTPPPQARPVSGDWMTHSRSASQMTITRDGPPRPNSRGANSSLNYNDLSNHLSAREQEHVARMTGSSFFNLNSDNKKHQPQVNPMGLVGAIDAREREKKGIKEGMSNQMVQHAIAQRQHHHWQQQQHPQPAQSQMAPPPPAHGYTGQAGGNPNSVYNLPAASHTWDALNQSYRPEEPRRQSWYGQFASQQPQMYQQNPMFNQHPNHYGQPNANAHPMQY